MTAAGIAVCAMFWGISMACIAALIIMYLAARNERRELISRLYGNAPALPKEDAKGNKRRISAHEKAMRKWRHSDESAVMIEE